MKGMRQPLLHATSHGDPESVTGLTSPRRRRHVFVTDAPKPKIFGRRKARRKAINSAKTITPGRRPFQATFCTLAAFHNTSLDIDLTQFNQSVNR